MTNTNIYPNNNINFCASPCGTTEILRNIKNKYKPFKVSVVSLNPREVYDLQVINSLAEKWDKMKGGYFAINIAEMASKEIKQEPDTCSNIYYALTTQINEFKKLEPEKVLALAVVEEKPKAFRDTIKWLQGNPEFNFYAGTKRLYKNVCKQLVLFIRNFKDKKLEVKSAKDSIAFYENLGFYRPFDSSQYFMHLD